MNNWMKGVALGLAMIWQKWTDEEAARLLYLPNETPFIENPCHQFPQIKFENFPSLPTFQNSAIERYFGISWEVNHP